MEWVTGLYGTTVGLDTAPLNYFIEKHPRYFALMSAFFEAVDRGDIRVITSTLTMTEVLVHPFRYGRDELIERYSRILLNGRNLRTIPVSPFIAIEAARIRAEHGIRTPDAIQLATAQSGGAISFLTNDEGLGGITGVRMIRLNGLIARP